MIVWSLQLPIFSFNLSLVDYLAALTCWKVSSESGLFEFTVSPTLFVLNFAHDVES